MFTPNFFPYITPHTYIPSAAAVIFIDLRDRYAYDESKRTVNDGMESSSSSSDDVTRNEAQLSAMVQNAKNSSWQENLRNAADAQERFMLPGRNVDGDSDKVPEYISNISKRSEEIIETKRREKESRNDQSLTRFWK